VDICLRRSSTAICIGPRIIRASNAAAARDGFPRAVTADAVAARGDYSRQYWGRSRRGRRAALLVVDLVRTERSKRTDAAYRVGGSDHQSARLHRAEIAAASGSSSQRTFRTIVGASGWSASEVRDRARALTSQSGGLQCRRPLVLGRIPLVNEHISRTVVAIGRRRRATLTAMATDCWPAFGFGADQCVRLVEVSQLDLRPLSRMCRQTDFGTTMRHGSLTMSPDVPGDRPRGPLELRVRPLRKCKQGSTPRTRGYQAKWAVPIARRRLTMLPRPRLCPRFAARRSTPRSLRPALPGFINRIADPNCHRQSQLPAQSASESQGRLVGRPVVVDDQVGKAFSAIPNMWAIVASPGACSRA
jgi:hypothetical protein